MSGLRIWSSHISQAQLVFVGAIRGWWAHHLWRRFATNRNSVLHELFVQIRTQNEFGIRLYSWLGIQILSVEACQWGHERFRQKHFTSFIYLGWDEVNDQWQHLVVTYHIDQSPGSNYFHFFFHPYLGRWSNLQYFLTGLKHQPDYWRTHSVESFFLGVFLDTKQRSKSNPMFLTNHLPEGCNTRKVFFDIHTRKLTIESIEKPYLLLKTVIFLAMLV